MSNDPRLKTSSSKGFFIFLLFLLPFIHVSLAIGAEEDGLLTLNKTLIIQTIIFIGAVFTLNELIFKPFLRLAEKRNELTAGAIEEAEEVEKKTENVISEYEAKINEAREEALEERNEIRREAQTKAEGMIEEARGESQKLIEEAKAKIERESKETWQKIKPDVEVIAREMSSRVLGREVRGGA